MNIWKLAWKNLLFNRLNSTLSVILIAFGVGLMTLLILFKHQFKEQFDKNQAGINLVVGAKGSPLQLILSSMFHVDNPTGNIKIGDAKFLFNPKHPLIDLAVPLSIGDSYKGFRIIGTNHDIVTLYPAKMQEGTLWGNGFSVNIGSQVAQKTGLKVGDTFFSSHGFNDGDLEHDEGEPFRVSGIFAPHGSVIDRLILCNTKAIWDVHDHSHDDNHGHDHHDAHDHSQHEHDHNHEGHNHEEHDHSEHSHEHDHSDHHHGVHTSKPFNLLDYPEKSITSALITWKKGKEKSLPVINMPRNINESTPVMATSPPYQLNKLIDQVGSGLKAIEYLAYLIALISALSIFISMYNNLKERKEELSIMRIGGAKPIQLFSLVQYEALFIGILGALFGVILGYVGAYLISNLISESFNYSIFSVKMYPEIIWLIIITIFISCLSAIIPSLMAYKSNRIIQ